MTWFAYIVAILFLAAIWTKISQIQGDLAAIRADIHSLRDL